MKILNSEMTSLLDKLYNLRGEDSVILLSMDQEKEMAQETKDRTSAQKAELESKISDLTSEGNVLASEGEKLLSALSMLKKEDFANVIEQLDLDFDPEAIKNKVDETLPLTMERVASERNAAEEELALVEEEMNSAITKIEELGIRKDEALSNQERLNRYIELALDSNINITRDEITSLLAKFELTEDEQREAAKLLMFPEDGLFEYEESYKDRPVTSKSISEVIQEAKEITPIVDFDALASNVDEEITPVITEEEDAPMEFAVEDVAIDAPVIEPIIEPVMETNELQTDNGVTKEMVIELLTGLGFDYLDFTNNDFAKIIENYDEATIAENVELIKELKMNKDVFNDNIELFYDKELRLKIETLTSVGKAPRDIYLNPNVLVKYDLDGLQIAIRTLHESGLEPKNVPLMAY